MLAAPPSCVILSDSGAALLPLCGISAVERLLRILQRLDFKKVTLLTSSAVPIREHLEKPSWARADLQLEFQERARGALIISEIQKHCSLGGDRVLLLRGDFVYDARLLAALAKAEITTLLIDSKPPPGIETLWIESDMHDTGACLLTREWLAALDAGLPLMSAVPAGEIARIDAAAMPAYVRDQRATIRPVFFPSPTPDRRDVAERVLQNAAQKGTLDIPAMVHAPIETWLVSKLWHTSIRPNHLSALTMVVGLGVTVLYASGRLGTGVVIALVVGVLDGLDGKLARTKVETTSLGKWEHDVDYVVETSWWLALAYHFATTKTVPHAWLLWVLLCFSELVDRATRGWVKKRLDRNLDDVSAFDRVVRLIGARRNIYTWIFALGLLLGAPAKAFVLICCWGIATAAIHIVRGFQLRQVVSR